MSLKRLLSCGLLSLSLMISFGAVAAAQLVGGVFSQQTAERLGLRRAWYVQANLNNKSGSIAGMTLHNGTLFVQTNRGVLQAINADTGESLYSLEVGNPDYPNTTPAANEDFVAAVNGSTVYLFDRNTGREVWHKQLPDVPGAGPAMSKEHVFVPIVNGTIYGFSLRDKKAIPWLYKSFGRILVSPIATSNKLSWTTEQGYLYLMNIADPDNMRVNYRLETKNTIESRPGYWTPYLYGASLDGYVFAVNEKTGQIDWKFPTAEPVTEAPVAVEGKVYICTARGGMYCLNGTTGEEIWYAPGVTQFISASPRHLYAVNRLNQLVILDAKTGRLKNSVSLNGVVSKMVNLQTDRIYLTTTNGVIQCLHDIDLPQPATYTPPPLKEEEKPKIKQRKLADEDADEPAADAPADAAMDAEAEDVFGGDEPEADKPAEEAPKEVTEDHPFG